jgi:hypothetical protein
VDHDPIRRGQVMRIRESQVLIEQVLGRAMICNKIEFNVEVVFFANVEV